MESAVQGQKKTIDTKLILKLGGKIRILGTKIFLCVDHFWTRFFLVQTRPTEGRHQLTRFLSGKNARPHATDTNNGLSNNTNRLIKVKRKGARTRGPGVWPTIVRLVILHTIHGIFPSPNISRHTGEVSFSRIFFSIVQVMRCAEVDHRMYGWWWRNVHIAYIKAVNNFHNDMVQNPRNRQTPLDPTILKINRKLHYAFIYLQTKIGLITSMNMASKVHVK